jgi:hypothetical protein
MIRSIILVLTFLLPLCSFGQVLPDSVVINSITYVNNYNGGDTLYGIDKYSIVRHGSNYTLNSKSINKEKVVLLLQELAVPSNSINTLIKYGVDTAWVRNNPEDLLKLYPDKDRVEWNQEQRKFIYGKLTSIKDHQRQLDYYLNSGCCYTMHNSYRYQFQINVYANGNLTDQISSRKKVWGYYYPWTNSKSDTLYNYEIENKVNKLLSLKSKAKAPISGNKLLEYLVKNIVDNNMQALYKLSAYSYLNEINELKSHFEIVSFEEVYGRGRYIWNEPKTMKIQLKNQSMFQNVNLCFLASKQGNTIYTRDSLKKEYKTITDRIQSIEFIKNHLNQNPKSKLDIYYFNNNGINDYNIESVNKNPSEWVKHDKWLEGLKWDSLHNIKLSFDVNESIKTSERVNCGCNYRFERSYIERAIFFEIHDSNHNSSIWFLLPDNKVLLYLMQGDKVLNFSHSEFGKLAGLQYPCVLFDKSGQRIDK